MKEMGVNAIGDRVYMLDMILLLKKKKKELESSATLWSGETPAPGLGKLFIKETPSSNFVRSEDFAVFSKVISHSGFSSFSK